MVQVTVKKIVLDPCKFYLIIFSLNYYLNYWIWEFINILKNLNFLYE